MAARDLNMVPILSYPKDTTNTVTLTLGDMNRLDEGQFLNDSLIPPPW
jgi:Ulp1 family protease